MTHPQLMIPAWNPEGVLMPMDKLEVHQRGLRHPAISVFVRRGGQILLQQRALSKYHTPGLWANTCCTHPWWGESSADAATRRLREELGITGLELKSVGQIEYRADVGQGLTEHEVVDVFMADAPQNMPLALNPDEVAQTAWADADALLAEITANPEDYTPWLRIYLQEHRTQIFG